MRNYDSWKTHSPDDDLEDAEEPSQEQQRADYEDEMQQQDDSAKRAIIAYEAFRGGLISGLDPEVPRWEDAPSWIRDVVLVAYLQGKLDAPKSR